MSDPITRLNAALSGRYLVERALGEGGMATVYLADDLRHERKVALKVLKPELAALVGAQRFLAEIKTTANLQHPHILPLHDSGEAAGLLFYVMPHVKGESLRARLDHEHQLPVGEAVRIATAVAHALDYAHRHGVIHRDIKPANILLQDGEPVVADFGIALAMSAAGGARLTETGLSLGTPHYMSPEQATGDVAVGAATDIYALGCVTYEMLVGEPPYTGSTAQAVLGKIIQAEPVSATKMRRSVPANVDAAIRKALEKVPADRFTNAHDFAEALADAGFHGPDVSVANVAHSDGRWRRIALAAVGMAAALAAALGRALWSPDAREPLSLARFEVARIETFGGSGGGTANIDLSGDGTEMVYVRTSPTGPRMLWRRRLDELEPSPVPGTQRATSPSLSPDGTRVVFSAGAIVTVPLGGGSPTTVAPIVAADVTWGPDGWLYFTQGAGLARLPESGGEPDILFASSSGRPRFPTPLPGGGGVVFTLSVGGLQTSSIVVLPPGEREPRELLQGTMARYAASGHIVYTTAAGALMAAPFDIDRLEVTGPSVLFVDRVELNPSGAASFAVSASGTLLYATEEATPAELVWVDRGGNVEPLDPAWQQDFGSLALSWDGTRAAVSVANEQIWVKQLDRGPSVRLTFEGSINSYPSWTPDDGAVTFYSDRQENFDIWSARADGSGRTDLLVDLPVALAETRWSPDGEWLVLRTSSLEPGAGDILALRPALDSIPTPLLETPFAERSMSLAPDGRWLAYTSNETGEPRVYVVPFPNVADVRFTISAGLGTEPVWARSGREIFYRDGEGRMVAVQVTMAPAFSVGPATVLFDASAFRVNQNHANYDVAPGEQRFLMVRAVGGGNPLRLIWVQGFFDELRRRAPN